MVLVSILGDFHSSILPVFFEYKDKITKHIIIHDDSEHDNIQLKKILKGQKLFLDNYEDEDANGLNFEFFSIQVDEDCQESIKECGDAIMKYEKDFKNIYFNFTDGLTSISIVLINRFLKEGSVAIVYDRYANTYNLHVNDFMSKYKIKNSIDIKNHLRLQGFDIINFTNKFLLQSRKNIILEMTKNLNEFKRFSKTYTKGIQNNLHYDLLVEQLGDVTEQFVKGGVFEEYIYWLINDNFEVDDIMTGVTIGFEKDVNNEIDILIMKDNHLHVVECKFTDNFKTSEYLYKLDTIINYIDDDSKGMILSVGGKSLGVHDRARASKDNICFYATQKFNEKDFIEEIKKWFGLKEKNVL